MTLDKYTFGKSPAAMYLTLLLNEQDSPALARKVSRLLCRQRELMEDLVACHLLTDELKTRSFSRLLNMLDDRIREAALQLPDAHIGNLVTNILIGELKVHKNRTMLASRHQRRIARMTQSGVRIPMMKATPLIGEETSEEKNKRLVAQSSAYLARKGKLNTLY
jgi:hypothetical protein